MKTVKWILLFSVILILTNYGFAKGRPNEYEYKLAKGNENIHIDLLDEIGNNGLKLTIFFIPIDTETAIPLIKELAVKNYKYMITVSKSVLQDYSSELNKINTIKLQKPVGFDNYLNVRVYCEFTSKKGKVFSFGLTNESKNMLINDLVTRNNRFLYEFIIPFLPQSEVERYKADLKTIEF